MNRPLSSWAIGAWLCFAFWAQGDTVMAQASRPIDEMRGNCDDYALNVRKELATMASVPQKLTALPSRETAPPMSPIGQPLLVTLHNNTDKILLAATPKQSGRYSRLLAFSVPTDGHYRISVGSAVWIEVVDSQARVEPTKFEMQTGCPTLFKTIQYRLKIRGGLLDRAVWKHVGCDASSLIRNEVTHVSDAR